MSAVVDRREGPAALAPESSVRPWLVFFGEDWGRHNSSSQYLARELAQRYRILWVNSLGLRAPRLDRGDLRRIAAKLAGILFRRGRNEGAGDAVAPAGIVVTAPVAVPLLGWRLVRRCNRWLVGRHLRARARELGIERPVVVTVCPSTVDVLDVLAPVRCVYYCADEHAALAGMDAPLVRKLEAELLARVDTVVAVSRALVAVKSLVHRDVRYLPHGVTWAALSPAALEPQPVPADLDALPRPWIGYVGLIGEHLDFELIAATAARLPGVSFGFIGPVEAGIEPPCAANLHYLGPRQHVALAPYLAHFAVGLLPWREGERNRFANPAKVREYLAAGCPVVATPHPELEGVSAYIDTATDADGFAAAIRRRLAHAPPRAAVATPMAAADWSVRAEVLAEALRA